MELREVFLSTLILGILVFHVSAARHYKRHHDDGDDVDSEEYRQIKRFIFGHDTTTTTGPPSVLGFLVHPPTTGRTQPPYIWPERTSTYSPWNPNPSTGACASHSCEHGGICVPKGQVSYECKCVGPWRGIFCSYADACVKSPCRNGGTCRNVLDDYWCECTNDYYGLNCESKFSNAGGLNGNNYNNNNAICQSNTCNTGKCVPLQTTYYCQCPNDRYGVNCEKTISYYKRDFSKRRTLNQLLNKIKRDQGDQDDSDESNAGDASEE